LHAFYLTRPDAKRAVSATAMPDRDLCPWFFVAPSESFFDDLRSNAGKPIVLADGSGNAVDLTGGPDLARLLALFDGKTSFGNISARLRDEILHKQPIDMNQIADNTLAAVWGLFHKFDWMLASSSESGWLQQDGQRRLSVDLPK